MTLGPLHAATRDLHHACEEHPVGAAMASGAPPADWYARWLAALRAIHAVTDEAVPAFVRRIEALDLDLKCMAVAVPTPEAAVSFAAAIREDETLRDGAIYVLIGAHLFGGELMRRRLEWYPTAHLAWPNRAAAIEWFKPLRQREELTDAARRCFACLLACMDEIAGSQREKD